MNVNTKPIYLECKAYIVRKLLWSCLSMIFDWITLIDSYPFWDLLQYEQVNCTVILLCNHTIHCQLLHMINPSCQIDSIYHRELIHGSYPLKQMPQSQVCVAYKIPTLYCRTFQMSCPFQVKVRSRKMGRHWLSSQLRVIIITLLVTYIIFIV